MVHADFSYRPVFSYDLLIAVSELHPLAGEESVRIQQITAYPAVIPTVGTYGHRFEDAVGCRLSVAARVAVESSGWGVMKSFVRAGHGIAVIPSCCITEKDRVRGIRFSGYSHREDCGVFTRPRQFPIVARHRLCRDSRTAVYRHRLKLMPVTWPGAHPMGGRRCCSLAWNKRQRKRSDRRRMFHARSAWLSRRRTRRTAGAK